MKIPSPITGGETILIRTIPLNKITDHYKDLDMSRYFRGLSEIQLRKCLDTGYQFYYPFTVAGDGSYYDYLSKNEWYYMPWKWEYGKALEYVESGSKIMEIGCGNGDFLEKAKERGADCFGLELNDEAVKKCIEKGLRVHNKDVATASMNMAGQFDLVCAFQVLEHIHNVKIFIESAVRFLKPGGILIFGVPNNSSFIKKDPNNLLNMPPHHMGLWRPESLQKLTNYFPLSVVALTPEPLQKYHFWYYYNVHLGPLAKIPGRVAAKLRYLLFKYIAEPAITKKSAQEAGHTILAIYKKHE